jgi:hypothetical protein
MKKLVTFFATAAAVALLMTAQSCSKTCDPGYEGSDCKALKSAKFIGNWAGTDACDTFHYAYTFTNVASSSSLMNISISNFGGFGPALFVTGNIDSTNSSVIHLTNQSLGGLRTVTGTITLTNSTTITTQYVVTPATGSAQTCAGTFTKQ